MNERINILSPSKWGPEGGEWFENKDNNNGYNKKKPPKEVNFK